jgi:hypothetical protein
LIGASRAILLAIVLLAGAAPVMATTCPGLIEHLKEHFAQAATRWNPDPWEYSYGDTVVWTEVTDLQVDVTALSFHAPLPGRQVRDEWQETEPCSLTVQKEFYVGPDTLATTFARIPEACSEAPALIWQGPDQRRTRRSLPPLFNWNIAALWCTEHYLVFGLEAYYELSMDAVDDDSGHAECIAFWHLPSGNVHVALETAHSAEGKRIRPPVILPKDFPSWKAAEVAESGDGILFRGREKTLIFLPATRELARIVLD